MTIEVEQIKKLIEDYRRSESVCIQSGKGPVASGQASVWRMVIEDLESLLPRKSMADVDPEMWPELVGTWVENEGVKRIISCVESPFGGKPIELFDPSAAEAYLASPSQTYPLDDIPPAWTPEGDPA